MVEMCTSTMTMYLTFQQNGSKNYYSFGAKHEPALLIPSDSDLKWQSVCKDGLVTPPSPCVHKDRICFFTS